MKTGGMKRYNTRPCKACKTVTSVLGQVTTRSVKIDRLGWVLVFESDSGEEFHVNGSLVMVPCRGCGALRYAMAVSGKFSAVHVCNARCVSSKGFVCECSCGGKNHGAGHSAAPAAKVA